MRLSNMQLTMFGLPPTEHVVNVASVPHRSPFRYPGGKTWLVPRIRQWLKSFERPPSLLIEPFAGGAIVGLTAAFEELVEHVILVELDAQIAAVWKTLLSSDAAWLADRILSFKLTIENVRSQLSKENGEIREQAFSAILKNRTYHGGILAPGSALIKTGENGKGIRSRWYPETLAKRIRDISKIRDRFTFIHGDGIDIIQSHRHKKQAVFFIDPPYTAGEVGKRAGSRLYVHHHLDHKKLFTVASRVSGDVLLTYDDDPSVRSLAREHSFKVVPIAMKNTHHARMTELLIGTNLEWIR